MRPRHDSSGGKPSRQLNVLVRAVKTRLRRRRDGSLGDEPCPVEPNRPLDLSGGAAAALEFDD